MSTNYRKLVGQSFTSTVWDKMGKKFVVMEHLPKCAFLGNVPALRVASIGNEGAFFERCSTFLDEYVPWDDAYTSGKVPQLEAK